MPFSKAVLSGRLIAIKAYVKKQEKLQINDLTLHLKLPGASVRNSAHGKGHEEGGSAYARRDRASGVSLDTLEHLPPKPEFAYFTALCSHLHL